VIGGQSSIGESSRRGVQMELGMEMSDRDDEGNATRGERRSMLAFFNFIDPFTTVKRFSTAETLLMKRKRMRKSVRLLWMKTKNE
jgi:hypothetical protein